MYLNDYLHINLGNHESVITTLIYPNNDIFHGKRKEIPRICIHTYSSFIN